MNDKEQIIRSRVEILRGFHNKHAQQSIANIINLRRMEHSDPKDVVDEQAIIIPGSDQPTMRRITVAQQRKIEYATLVQQCEVLKVIENMLDENGDACTDKTAAVPMIQKEIEHFKSLAPVTPAAS